MYRDANTSIFCCQRHFAGRSRSPTQDLPGHHQGGRGHRQRSGVRPRQARGLVPNLEKSDFTILEDGKPQEIKYFTKETDLPLTIGLLVDVSGSQRNLIEIERNAASQFFSQVLRKKDMAFLISFGEEAELLQDYTNSRAPPDRRAESAAVRVRRQRTSSRPGADHRAVRAAPSCMTRSISRRTIS